MMKNDDQLTTHLPSSVVQAFSDLAKLDGKDTSSFVRNILMAYLDKRVDESRILCAYAEEKRSNNSVRSN